MIRVIATSAATGEPVEGALVRSYPVDARHPLDIGAMLRPFSPRGDRARTAADGSAQLRSGSGGPVRLAVVAPGFVPWGLMLERPPAGGTPVVAAMRRVEEAEGDRRTEGER